MSVQTGIPPIFAFIPSNCLCRRAFEGQAHHFVRPQPLRWYRRRPPRIPLCFLSIPLASRERGCCWWVHQASQRDSCQTQVFAPFFLSYRLGTSSMPARPTPRDPRLLAGPIWESRYFSSFPSISFRSRTLSAIPMSSRLGRTASPWLSMAFSISMEHRFLLIVF